MAEICSFDGETDLGATQGLSARLRHLLKGSPCKGKNGRKNGTSVEGANFPIDDGTHSTA